jgi:hypothetical protein
MNLLQRFEVWVSLLVILICVIFLWESWDLPPGSFEPLGSGPVPQATAFVVIFCAGLVILNALKKSVQLSENEDTQEKPSIRAGLIISSATVVYSLVLHLRLMPFAWMTTLFLIITIWGLEKFDRKKFLPALITAIIIGFASEYLFTEVFIVDLPT